jgi:hypothetical protein
MPRSGSTGRCLASPKRYAARLRGLPADSSAPRDGAGDCALAGRSTASRAVVADAHHRHDAGSLFAVDTALGLDDLGTLTGLAGGGAARYRTPRLAVEIRALRKLQGLTAPKRLI